MTCAACQQPICEHSDAEYAGTFDEPRAPVTPFAGATLGDGHHRPSPILPDSEAA